MKTSIAMLFHASDLFTKTFFGETNAEVAHVTEGRFAHVRVRGRVGAVCSTG